MGDYVAPFDRLLVTEQVVAEYEYASVHYLCACAHTPQCLLHASSDSVKLRCKTEQLPIIMDES